MIVTRAALAASPEELVFEGEHRATAGGEVPAANQPLRVAAGGAVERFGHRGPPVDDQRFLGLAGHRDPADVVTAGPGVLRLVDPAEAQRTFAELQLAEPVSRCSR